MGTDGDRKTGTQANCWAGGSGKYGDVHGQTRPSGPFRKLVDLENSLPSYDVLKLLLKLSNQFTTLVCNDRQKK